MMNIGYNNRWVRLIKDILFVALACWIATRQSVLAVIVGVLAAFWYGRDAYFQIKALWQEKTYRPSQETPAQEDGKITVTNLSDAKEVDFEKE